MTLWSRWFSRPEDRTDAWVTQQYQQNVLEGKTTPVGPCPDHSFLDSLAKNPDHAVLSDPRVEHAGTCPICMRHILVARSRQQARQRQLVFAAAICFLIIATALILFVRHSKSIPSGANEMAVVSKTVNLWDEGTVRSGQTGSLQSVSLPSAMVQVKIILPRYSDAGRYVVAVTRDQAGHGLVAQSDSTASAEGDREVVSVNLDLTKSTPGVYFLSTTHDQDQASYYYPLQIK